MGALEDLQAYTYAEVPNRWATVLGNPGYVGHLQSTGTAKLSRSVKDNLTATSDPGVNDDSNAGYDVTSLWRNTTDNGVFFCRDASAGAADWIEMGVGGGGGGVSPNTWDANSLVKADVDNTPIVLVVPPNAIVARGPSGGIVAQKISDFAAHGGTIGSGDIFLVEKSDGTLKKIDFANMATAIANAVLAAVIDDTITLKQALATVLASTAGKSTGVDTNEPAYYDPTGATKRVEATIDASGNRSSVVLTPP